MIRFDVLFVILRPKECEGAIAFESEHMCAGVTVRSKLDGRDPALADRHFLVSEPFAPLYTILAYFLLSWTTLVCKKNPLWPFLRFLSRKRLLRSIIRSSRRPSSPSSPFHVVRLSISFRSPRRLASRGLRLCHIFRPVDYPPTTTLGLKRKTHLPASFVISNLFPTSL